MAATTPQLIAHVLRRTTFGPFPGQVEALKHLGVTGAINALIDRPTLTTSDTPDLSNDSSDDPVKWWLGKMADPAAGVHEKMTWFLHGTVTVSHSKVFWWDVEWPAHLLLRKYAMGSYRSLLKKMTITPAMLIYLDGSWSTVQGPNENYARELQELFSIGQKNVTQTNVSNGALALAGWYVDWDTATANFTDERWASLGSNQKVSFLGKQVYRYDEVVDAVCDHHAMPGFIATKLWNFLVGAAPSATKVSSLAAIIPVVRPQQQGSREGHPARPHLPPEAQHATPLPGRSGSIAATAAMGLSADKQLAVDQLWGMGQLPFYPPNVAGWPSGDRWISPALALAKAALAVESKAIAAVVNASDPVAAALTRCSIFEVSSQTRQALNTARNHITGTSLAAKQHRATVLLALCLSSPEFALA